MRTKAFTFIEIIIYIAVIAIVLVSAMRILWDVIGGSVRVSASTEIAYSARLVLDNITRAGRGANDVLTASSTFGTHPGVLVFSNTGGDITFDTAAKNIIIGGQSVTIRKLRMKTGAGLPIDLTSDKVDVTNFVVKNRTRGTEPKNVKVEVTLAYVNPGQDIARSRTLSFETAVSIRKH
ncbi:hypothetical protein HZA42_02455 [Candidatus Peregrinibacteria bacterium]|nr:hypothetical protein [Candidatus Peregrinibacteria bacterium]